MTFWENIDVAESLSLFQKKNIGVEGSVGTLFSGETVTDITSADHAGFILTLSSGRIAQISLRDTQGKPKVTAQFLRSNDAANSSGLFGGIKSVLGVGAWKRDVVGVRTRTLGSRGQMQVIAGTESAQLQVWDLAWSGQSTFKGSIDFKPLLQDQLATLGSAEKQVQVQLLDLAILPDRVQGDEVTIVGQAPPMDLLLLAQIGSQTTPDYVLVEVALVGKEARLERVTPARRDSNAEVHQMDERRPRLMLPNPGHTAFIVFEQKIMVVAIPPEDTSPEAQLLMESSRLQEAFQDTIHLRRGKHLTIEGLGEEDPHDKSGTASGAIFIKGFGLVRMTANQPNPSHSKIPIKSKLEQAIYYGTMPDNIFDFSNRIGTELYSQEEVEEAAISISDEILRSQSPFIPTVTSSTEDQLSIRQKALAALINYIKKNYAPISRPTAWRLLQDAEKVAAALALWRQYDSGLQQASRGGAAPTWVRDTIMVLGIQAKRISPGAQKDIDTIREWFTFHVDEIDHLRNSAMNLVSHYYEDGRYRDLMRQMSEADDIVFTCYDSVYEFRKDNAEAYGFDQTMFTDGILEEGQYTGLVEPWTSYQRTFNAFHKFIDVVRDFCVSYYDKLGSENTADAVARDEAYLSKCVRENAKLVDIMCLCYRERIAWMAQHEREETRRTGEIAKTHFKQGRHHHLTRLSDIGQAGAGIAIAEKYRDLGTLCRLVVDESNFLIEAMNNAETDEVENRVIQEKMDELQHNVDRYFKIFGDEWATVFFDSHLTSHRSFGLLNEADSYREPLTRYLRADPARARLGWINEVLTEHSFEKADKALTQLAREQENNLWSKKVELSLGKLAAIAVAEENSSSNNPVALDEAVQPQNAELTITNIQQDLYSHLLPIIISAVDHDAELQLVSDTHAKHLRRTHPALHQLLEIAFEDLLAHKVLPVEQLLDVLTLMAPVSNDGSTDIAGREFHLAFRVLAAARPNMDDARWHTALRIVWKRLFLRDSWDAINGTARKTDALLRATLRDTALCQTLAAGRTDVFAAAKAQIPILSPTEVLGAGSDEADLAARFPSPDLRDPIVHDNGVQDAALQAFVDGARLAHWVGVCEEEAKKMAWEEVEREGREEARLAELGTEMREGVEKSPVQSPFTEGKGRGKGELRQGSWGGSRSAGEVGEKEVDGIDGGEDIDGDGDVEME